MNAAPTSPGTGPVPTFHCVGPGLWETADGVYQLRQLDGGSTRAWNVELTTDEVNRRIDADPENVYVVDDLLVDGAATKRDALALFADWWTGH